MQRPAFYLARLAVVVPWLLAGCNSPMFDWLPFEPKERTTYQTPPKRIAQLEELASAAGSSSAAERDEVSRQLAEQIAGEDDPLMRMQILRTLARYKTPTSDTVLKVALKDNTPEVRMLACRLVGKLEASEAVGPLAEVVQSDTDVDVRMAAARALGPFEDSAAVPALAVALDDPNPALQLCAVESLKSVTGRNFGNDVVAWRQYVRGEEPGPAKSISMAERLRSWSPF